MSNSNGKNNSPLIFVVEDEKNLRLLLRRAMEKEGYRVVEAENGEDCLEACQQLKPNLVLLDAILPGIDGFICCTQLRTLLGNDCPPILMMTALHDKASVDQAFEVGATDFITKPIYKIALRQRVRCLLQGQLLVQEYAQRERLLQKQLEAANREIQRIASIDGLTRLANRRYFEEYIQREWKRSAREKKPLSLILADIDFFKAYNETYGYQAGDECLKKVAETLRRVAKRPADLVARYGSEEFAVLLPNTPTEGAVQVAEAMRSEVKAQGIAHAGSQVSPLLTISLGVATIVPNRSSSVDKLITEAEEALYQAKLGSRDRVALNLGTPFVEPVPFTSSTPLIWGESVENMAEF